MTRSGRRDVRVPVLDLSYEPMDRPARAGDAAALGVAVVASRAAGWPGVVLPPACIVGAMVFPVVELTGAGERLRTETGPERSLTTLAQWEAFDGMPPSPVRIVGFVSAEPRWSRALASVHAVAGLGAGLVVCSRAPSRMRLLDADADGVWVVTADRGAADLLVRGRNGALPSARRVPATRLIEEGLFAHALSCDLVTRRPQRRGP